MKDSTEHQAHGKLHEVKGQLKQAAGVLLDNPVMEAEGNNEKVLGKIENKIGQIEKVLEK